MIFSGFRSLWTILLVWQYATADRICLIIEAASFSQKVLAFWILSNNSPPLRYLLCIDCVLCNKIILLFILKQFTQFYNVGVVKILQYVHLLKKLLLFLLKKCLFFNCFHGPCNAYNTGNQNLFFCLKQVKPIHTLLIIYILSHLHPEPSQLNINYKYPLYSCEWINLEPLWVALTSLA